MAGGKGNIKPEDGKQFSSEYQPQEKWTEKKALDVGGELIEWMKSEDENIFMDDFLVIVNDYPEGLISYLSKKFTSFSNLIDKAKQIQKTKLIKFGVMDKLNAPMTKFVLTVNHDMVDKVELNNNHSGAVATTVLSKEAAETISDEFKETI